MKLQVNISCLYLLTLLSPLEAGEIDFRQETCQRPKKHRDRTVSRILGSPCILPKCSYLYLIQLLPPLETREIDFRQESAEDTK